jgi:chromosome partitioning protein
MRITLCNGKGGTGKTTLTVLLAHALAEAGKEVAVVDLDPQGTASRWLAQFPESKVQLAQDGQDYAAVFTDTPPRLDSPALAASIREADSVLLVCSPSPADLWSAQDTAKVIRENLRPRARGYILFNAVQPNTILGRDLEDLAERIGLSPLKASIHRRQAYQHAALLGWKALTTEAREEIYQVALAVLSK